MSPSSLSLAPTLLSYLQEPLPDLPGLTPLGLLRNNSVGPNLPLLRFNVSTTPVLKAKPDLCRDHVVASDLYTHCTPSLLQLQSHWPPADPGPSHLATRTSAPTVPAVWSVLF